MPVANVTQWNSTNVSSPATAGIPDVNVKNIDNDAASASGTVTFPGTLASTTNITAATGVDVTKLNGVAQSLVDLKDFADDGYDPVTNKVQGVVLTDTVTTYTSNTPQTGDSFAIVNSGTFGNAALKTLIDALIATVGVAGAGLTATATAVWAVATRLLTAGTNIVLAKGTGVTGFNDISAADVWAAGTRTLTSYGTLVADVATAVWSAVTRVLTAGTNIVLAKGVGVTGFNDPTVGAIADQVWDETIAGHLGAGSTGEALAVAAAGTAPTVDEIADEVETRAMTLVSAYDPAKTAATQTSVNGVPAAVLSAAGSAPIAADVKKINATTVIGNGSTTPWGP